MLEFKILGPLEVARDGRPVELGGRKQRAVLAALLVDAGQVVSLDRLLDQLWRDEAPASATATLQTYVSQLRRALEPDRAPRAPATVLVTQPPGYLIRIEPGGLDAARFEDLAARGQAALLAGDPALAETFLDEAVGLWRGEPLADLAGEEFLLGSSARLVELRLGATEDLVEARLALGRHAAIVATLEQLVAAHPLRDRLRGELMVALYRCGRQADALRVYAEGRERLADELGLDPGPALQQLELGILQQSPDLDLRPGGTAATAVSSGPPTGPRPGSEPTPRSDKPTATPAPEPTVVPAAGARLQVIARPAPLFGRDAEMARIDARLDAARQGAGGIVLVAGEAGIGKTQVAEAAAARAAELGMQVAWSRCDEVDGAPAFWPWTQILRGLLSAAVPLDARTEPALQLVPELAPVPQAISGEGAEGAEGDRFRLYDAVAGVLTSLAAGCPLVVVVDDIQWADASSLRLLQFIAAEASRLPLLVLATDRVEDRSNPVVADTLAALARERGVERIALAGLRKADLKSWMSSVADGELHPGIADAVHDRTGGNPFFVVELVRLLRSERRLDDPAGGGVPAGVRDVLSRRFARLPEPTRAVLQLAAVAGREFGPDLLAAAGGMDPDDVLDALEPAMLARLVVDAAEGFGRFRFSHALVREALYGTLAPIRRARLHRQLGSALEARVGPDPGPHLTELAYHFSEAAAGGAPGAAASAVEWCTRAAQQANDRLAHDEAAGYLRRALAALELDRPSDLEARYEATLELAQATHRTGDVLGAVAPVDQAIELGRRMGDLERVARAAVVFGGVSLWTWRPYGEVATEMVGLLERAARELPEEQAALRARVLGTLGVELMYSDDRRADADAYGRESVEIARRLGDPLGLARALNNYFRGIWVPGREGDRLAAVTEMVELHEHLPETVTAVGRLHRMMELLRAGDVEAWRIELDRLHELADVIRLPELLAQMRHPDVTLASLEGRFADAEALGEEAFEAGLRTNVWGADWCRSVQLVTLRRHQGRLGELVDELVALAATRGNKLIQPLAIYAAAAAGDEAGAGRLLDRWRTEPNRDWSWQFTATVWAEIAVLLGDPDPAAYADLLSDQADRLVVAGTSVGCWGSARLTLGRLAARLGQVDKAIAHFEGAAAANAAVGAAPWEATARWELAQALGRRDGRGDSERAGDEVAAAAEIAARLGMGGPAWDAVDVRTSSTRSVAL